MSNLQKFKQKIVDHNIDGYIIPTTDEYQNEYAPEYAKRLQFVTNFAGSNGIGIIGINKSFLITDGRYLTQAKLQLDLAEFEIIDIRQFAAFDFKVFAIGEHSVIGYDPKLFTEAQLKLFNKFNLKSIEHNIVDEIWTNQPQKPSSNICSYDVFYAGQSVDDKINIVRRMMKIINVDYKLISTCDVICWLLNIRASDVVYTPIMLGYLLISYDKIYLFTNLARTKIDIDHCKNIELFTQDQLSDQLKLLAGKVLIDKLSLPSYFVNLLQEYNLEAIDAPEACNLLKACKNETELKHTIDGHYKDAVAVCEFLAWFDALTDYQDINEYDIGEKLEFFRNQQKDFLYPSFATICGFGSNGAVIHYRADKNNALKIEQNNLLLIDSGAQYHACTTDITRVIPIGTASFEHIDRYTKVLKGHLRLCMAKFVKGTTGSQLDMLARYDLWQDELDYAHGTGHGVGAFLGVHEGPQSIAATSHVGLLAGMIVSNEPGFYEEGKYGIRIENLLFTKEAKSPRFLQFESLTLVPYAKKLINFAKLDPLMLEYLNSYYQKISEIVIPLLSDNAKAWVLNEINI